MSALAARLDQRTQSYSCGVSAVLASMDTADRKAFTAALSDPRWSARELSAVLGQEGYDRVGRSTIQTHRSEYCSCFRNPGK